MHLNIDMVEEQLRWEFAEENSFAKGKRNNYRKKMLKAFQNAAATLKFDFD